MKPAYYNEFDPYAAEWLRNLIVAGEIPYGDVDERSIEDVRPSDLAGYGQKHFFAGIGIWARALRDAGVPDDADVTTGSCPCQPFSAAGKGTGFADERHLWPAFHYLIEETRPELVLGEQVASSDAGPWLDLVQADMEGLGYAFGALAFPAASIGAPHIRDRTYWMADAECGPAKRQRLDVGSTASGVRSSSREQRIRDDVGHGGDPGGLADTDDAGRQLLASIEPAGICDEATRKAGSMHEPRADSPSVRMGLPGPTNGFWRVADWLLCRDGKWRPVEPGTFPLAHGATGRVGRLRAYGNAIVLPQATEFVRAALAATTLTV